jgi:hypothetical protein
LLSVIEFSIGKFCFGRRQSVSELTDIFDANSEQVSTKVKSCRSGAISEALLGLPGVREESPSR